MSFSLDFESGKETCTNGLGTNGLGTNINYCTDRSCEKSRAIAEDR